MKIKDLKPGDKFYFVDDVELTYILEEIDSDGDAVCVGFQVDGLYERHWFNPDRSEIKTIGVITDEIAQRYIEITLEEFNQETLENLSYPQKISILDRWWNRKRSKQDRLLRENGITQEQFSEYIMNRL